MKKTSGLGLMGLLVMGLSGLPARADTTDVKGACSADVQKYCSSVQPGGGRIAACLADNQSSVSSGCQTAIGQVKEKVQAGMKEFEAACGADLQKFCADVKPGEGRRIVCLKAHQNDVSSACQQQMAAMHGPHGRKGGDVSTGAKAPPSSAPSDDNSAQ